LKLFDRTNVTATFFVLGWVAERFPGLVREIARSGHEIASHGYDHRLVYALTPEEFRADLRRASEALENAAQVKVVGYRAPSFSITERSMWALDVLVEEGYQFDASIYPIRHDRYGLPTWPRQITLVERTRGALWELPGSTVRMGGVNLPVGGGGYFRLFPYGWTRRGLKVLNQQEGEPAIFYLHPWEVDPGQPRLPASALSRWRHYTNLHKTEDRLRRMLGEFRFGPVSEVLAAAASRLEAEASPAALLPLRKRPVGLTADDFSRPVG
jgi:polysaccharide deacetylase family protein (PEP-CTERM system associated)